MVSPLLPIAEETPSIKLLDLLTNRYHAGVVRRSAGSLVQVEMPASARLRPGQRVRCIIARPSAGVLARGDMRRAAVLHIEPPAQATGQVLELAFMDEP